ncbi:enoyl-CoA hydratase/isomerase family protein [Colwellia sp. MB02u-10]|jgi:2-(1,2-epoxy-1,2-dihydrophenyl)acetyl-CoA isomerase|uniref:enoyl-CoA hydratase/isomerase family protein n=1 Tax=Colwellia sp. MB02u-10 TaxID=2759828 RepID=UPI0015F68249|nr:enoyl-CoA hydratase-related protein [Colwellia sp. MB02u-10]MBA6339634.1 enoyl-CoA hydratase/isomerase family protein [Colwellia sp. MB02u-10]
MKEITSVVHLERYSDGVATLSMMKEKTLNALDETLLVELLEKLKEADADDDIKVVILTGSGRGFCSGVDLTGGILQENADKLDDWIRQFANPVVECIRSMSTVVIAAVNGVAVGAGVSLALACDIVMSAASARYFLSFAKVGMAMDMGISWILTRRIGPMRTAALTMSAEFLDAEEALQWGLCYEVVDDVELMSRSCEFASRIASKSAPALRALKSQINFADAATLSESLGYEAEVQGMLVQTDQAQQLIKEFSER